MDWTHFTPALLTAFLASLVECIEALTVILAAGAVLGWRSAVYGTGIALCCLLAVVAILGPALTLVPSEAIHLGVGMLLLVFGVRWLRKAVLRAARVIPIRDEFAVYTRQSTRFRALSDGLDGLAHSGLMAAFNVTMVEGIEVVFVVLAIGAADSSLLLPASLGAFVAFLLVCALGIALHRPIARVPENTLKFAVGVLTCAFGIFWTGEALGVTWPGGDWSVLVLAAGILAAASTVVRLKAQRPLQTPDKS